MCWLAGIAGRRWVALGQTCAAPAALILSTRLPRDPQLSMDKLVASLVRKLAAVDDAALPAALAGMIRAAAGASQAALEALSARTLAALADQMFAGPRPIEAAAAFAALLGDCGPQGRAPPNFTRAHTVLGLMHRPSPSTTHRARPAGVAAAAAAAFVTAERGPEAYGSRYSPDDVDTLSCVALWLLLGAPRRQEQRRRVRRGGAGGPPRPRACDARRGGSAGEVGPQIRGPCARRV
ncbi:MAG: hypothetical protein J3K34DRAFT_390132 [Monoraphidium minutum]|nr:MAG: hypothetical protein J3K34DRAFT_390132 [Monoraphidium minutum]